MADITKFYFRGKGAKFIKFYLSSEMINLNWIRRWIVWKFVIMPPSLLKIPYLALFAPCAASDHQGLFVEN